MEKFRFRLAVMMLVTTLLFCTGAHAESFQAATMRLLQYEGTVEIQDASGKSRVVMKNARFGSGDILQTGKESRASVSLDKSRIVSLDASTQVRFAEESGHMQLTLQEGAILLDVGEKLDKNETLDIQTSSMMVGIRGTIIFLRETSPETADKKSEENAGNKAETKPSAHAFQIGVLEGTAEVTFEQGGIKRQIPVPANKALSFGQNESTPVVKDLTAEEIQGFVAREILEDSKRAERVKNATGISIETLENLKDPARPDENPAGSIEKPIPEKSSEEEDVSGSLFSADGGWVINDAVVIEAQSASKLYDGTPLISSGALVSGLDTAFTAQVNVSGSQTHAGSSDNKVVSYAIYNDSGENVTGHFSNCITKNGKLTVVPAQLTVWTGSAEKVYDGTPLVSSEIELQSMSGYRIVSLDQQQSVISTDTKQYKGLQSVQGYTVEQAPWRNSSLIVTNDLEKEIMYGISGVSWVHSTNPITGETKDVKLKAGERLEVILHSDENNESIELKILQIKEEEIPEDVLRLYAVNEDLLKQACADTGWELKKIRERIAALAERKETYTTKVGLKIEEAVQNKLMVNGTDVRLTVDSEITRYNDVSMGVKETYFAPVYVPDTIKVTATGSLTKVGETGNAYIIDWGREDPNDYVISNDLGTLKVTPAGAVVTTGSASKVYDGTPLTNAEGSITGLVQGESAAVIPNGSITEPGSVPNTYTIEWGSTDQKNYTVTENLGVLEITPRENSVVFTVAGAEKVYDGSPLLPGPVTVAGLPEGYTCTYEVSGSRTDAGTSESVITAYSILNENGQDVTGSMQDVILQNGTLTVLPAEVVVSTGSASKEYDGEPLTNQEADIAGLVAGDTAVVTAVGSITDVGTAENLFSIDWGVTNADNYTVTGNPGTLEITYNVEEIAVEVSLNAEKIYDGKPLLANGVKVSRLQTSGGTVPNAGRTEEQGLNDTAELPMAKDAEDGAPVFDDLVTVTGLPEGFSYSYVVYSSQIAAGISELTVTDFNIMDLNGKDVTSFFTGITTLKGRLEVLPAPCKITTGSASKMYDGKPLTMDEAGITGLVEGETAAVTATGSITNTGTAENTYSIDWGETDPQNYTITENLGMLEVVPDNSAIRFTVLPVEKIYDGMPVRAEAVEISGLPEGFTYVTTAGEGQKGAGTSESSLSGYKILNADGEDVTANFSNISTEAGTVTVHPAPVTITTGSASKMYDGTPLTCEEVSVTGLVDGETAAVTAAGSITEVGTTENTCTIDWGETDPSNYVITENLGTLEITPNDTEIIITAPTLEKTYDGISLNAAAAGAAGTIEITGLPEGFVCTAELAGSQTDAGSSASTVTGYKIWNSAEEDVTSCFSNVRTADGTLTVNPAELTITTGSAAKMYDGTPLTSSEVSIDGLAEGDRITVTATGAITEVGTTENTCSIDWGDTEASNYTVTETLGTLEITVNDAAVIITANSSEKAYDGTPLTNSTVTVTGLPTGYTYTATVTGSQTSAGSSENSVAEYRIFDESGNDVTLSFTDISIVAGTLKVNPAELTITTGSASREYDGTPLTSGEHSVTGLADGEEVTVTTTGTITEVGTTDNTCSIDWGETVSSNYTVTETLGTLEITANDTEITITAPTLEKTYDGTALNAAAEETKDVTGLPAGYTCIAEFSGTQTDVGNSASTVAGYKIYNSAEEDVTANFSKVTTVDGTLTVTPAELNITTGSASKLYDGTPLTSSEVTISGLAEGEEITVTTTGTITDVGTTDNTYNIAWGDTKSANYTVKDTLGTLEITVNDAAVIITANSSEKAYDGTPLTNSTVTVTGLPTG
ncbi:MAG: FecR domain-containing protein, partial [Blautia sp.]|nr:FecR domain-containing protein [Blautia sp.]